MTDDIARSTVARGNNYVLYAPPTPAAATSTLQGIVEGGRVFLGLVPLDAVAEWARVAGHLTGSSSRITATTSPDRLTRLIAAQPGLTFTTPETALEAIQRAGLKLADIAGILIIWPERWAEEGEQLATLLQEFPKEGQRVIVSSDPRAAESMVERYAWRAALGDELGQTAEPASVSVYTTPVSWAGRIESLADIVEQLDPASLTVWTASTQDHDVIRERLSASGANASISHGAVHASRIVVAYDVPSPGQLRELTEAGDVVLLVPPGTERYVAQLVGKRKPLHLTGALGRARSSVDKTRGDILKALETGENPAGLELLAPVFERYEATAVAAALLRMWQQGQTTAPGEPQTGREESAVKVWVSAGKRDGVTPNDLVAVLAKECEVPRGAIGRIEIRDSFALVKWKPTRRNWKRCARRPPTRFARRSRRAPSR